MDDRPTRLDPAEEMSGRSGEHVRDYAREPADRPGTRAAEYASRGTEGEEANRDPQRRVQEIRAEIEQTREDLTETIDAIQEKLRPRNLVAQATDSVKRATTERVRSMGRQTEQMLGPEAGGNAIPFALIGVGAAWLLARRTGSQGRESERLYRSSGQHGAYGDYSDYERQDREEGHGILDRIRHHPVPAALVGAGLAWLALADDNGDAYEESWDDRSVPFASRAETGYIGTQQPGTEGESLTERGREMADRLGSRAEEMTHQVSDRARRTTRRAQNGLQRLMRDNPLMVGAAAAMIGAAVGAALPETERENEWLGEAKETVVDRAQDMARGAADRAREAAGDLVAKTVTGSD